MNNRAIALLEDKSEQNPENELKIYEEFDSKNHTLAKNIERKYKVQEGAAQGKSLAKIFNEKRLSRDNLVGKI